MILLAAPLPGVAGIERYESPRPAPADVEHSPVLAMISTAMMGPSPHWSESRTSAPLRRGAEDEDAILAVVATPPVEVAPPPLPPPPAPSPVPTRGPSPAPEPRRPPAGHDATAALDPGSGNWLHRRAADALAMISYPWERLGFELVFEPARSGIRGQTTWSERRIQIFVRPSDSVVQTAFDLAHEVAHAFDFARGSSPGRWAWMRARDLESWEVWFGCDHCDDLTTPAGDFAESFAYWQVPAGPFGSRLGSPPSEAQRVLLAEITALD